MGASIHNDIIRIGGGLEIELRRIHPSAGTTPAGTTPTLVFLHEGLGCVAMWRDFPDRVAAALGWPAVAYSRVGYGRSTPWSAPPSADFMHRAARAERPQVLAALGIERPVLVGHSDGGSIALIAAAGPVRPLAVATLAPHVFVERVTIDAIARTREAWAVDGLATRLGRYHADAWATFRFTRERVRRQRPEQCLEPVEILRRHDDVRFLGHVSILSGKGFGAMSNGGPRAERPHGRR